MKIEDIFLTVAKHLLTQNAKAYSVEQEMFMYRGPGNTKCAVGCLIPDDKYQEELEDVSVHEQTVLSTLGYLDIDQDKYGLLQSLQTIHDYDEVDEWEKELYYLGEDYGFSEETLDKLKTFR